MWGSRRQIVALAVVLASLLSASVISVYAAQQERFAPDRVSDISNTKHNFSATATTILGGADTRTVKATSQTEVCVFCHTPHLANTTAKVPLWNRTIPSGAGYANYASSTTNATIGAPGDSSKLCLSCHDGTLAIGSVNVASGKLIDITVTHNPSGNSNPETVTYNGTGQDIAMSGGMGALVDTGKGYNPVIGTNLTNDHPIGFSYNDSGFASTVGSEIATPSSTLDTANLPVVGPMVSARDVVNFGGTISHPAAPLGPNDAAINPTARDKVECTTCHDPHIRGTGADANVNIKFLRLNRFQKNQSIGAAFSVSDDISCLACHRKSGWENSAHAQAGAQYTTADAQLREFPNGSKVWEASCLNCHDTHTVSGARYLLREGTDNGATPKSAGGNPAQEETCYQCHSATSALVSGAADIKSEFTKSGLNGHDLKYDINVGLQPNEVHAPTNADLLETQANHQTTNRHVECTDCHHPHRMTKNQLITSDPTTQDSSGTHIHQAGTDHTNIVSGALRGVTGVQPDYSGCTSSFDLSSACITYAEKKGDPGVAPGTDPVLNTYVTREFQVCFKCHSNYAVTVGAGVSNPAQEFRGDALNASGNNHRSWHPIMAGTANAALNTNLLVTPFNQAVGTQTMYCSDCHTSGDVGSPVGPHGSSNTGKMLTGNLNMTSTPSSGDFCFGCHKYSEYADSTKTDGTAVTSGFSCSVNTDCLAPITNPGTPSPNFNNLHIAHAKRDTNYACGQCHNKKSHGARNKALLVDVVNDPGTDASIYHATNAKLTVGPGGWAASGSYIEKNGVTDSCAGAGCH